MSRYTAAAVLIGCAFASAMAQAQTEVKFVRPNTSADQAAYYEQIAQAFEAQNPEVDIVFEYIANEAYKAKIPTLLQSNARPDIFYSWGGQTLVEQTEAGFTQDIRDALSPEYLATFPDSALNAFTVDGVLTGLPLYATEVVFWTNTDLTDKAGLDLAALTSWDDFLGAVQTLKDAGITPIVVGGQDKWPLHFYWSYLALREGGPDVINAAMDGDDKGFESAPFLAAGADFKQLVDMQPFQSGFMGTTYETASGMFADGAGAFHLMGEWDYAPMRERSSDGFGLSDDQLAVIRFPAISDPVKPGGDSATLGGINGWAVTSSASPEAVEFLAFMLQSDYQKQAAAEGIFIPIVKGAGAALENPFFRDVSDHLSASSYHQIFLDQYLGASVGATVNDISADLAQDVITPEDAAAQVQEAWDFR